MIEPCSHLGQIPVALASRYGKRPAILDERGEMDFRDLARAAEARAGFFRRMGSGRGARVGLLAGNGAEWLALAFGAWQAGLVLVPISTFVTPRELEEIVRAADLRILVFDPRFRARDLASVVARVSENWRFERVVSLPDVEREASSGAGGADFGEREDPACILFTSGTTAEPKGVELSHRALTATVWPTAERTGLDASDLLLSTLPLFWVAGLAIRALPTLVAGCALVLPESFAAETVLALLERYRPTALHLRPAQVGVLRSHPRFRPELFDRVRRGNGRTDWFPEFAGRDVRFITGYGMTEMSGYVTALDWRDPPEKRRFGFGKPLPGVEIRIVGPDGRALRAGETGEVRVRGPGLFSRYLGRKPASGLDAEGFFVTGDLGRFDEDGFFEFVGRTKDLLRVKGVNVSPAEVEFVLGRHPSVEAVHVVGLPPGAAEQEIVALVVVRPGARATEKELREHAERTLSSYKRPSHYLFVERGEIPLSSTSKPRRDGLERLAASRLGKREL
ncbi:MAG: AMP-binding protein [Candidatus Binatia bacterium]|nr:MAG: AMP-binding protein [Candidatus Binatia bacterium]